MGTMTKLVKAVDFWPGLIKTIGNLMICKKKNKIHLDGNSVKEKKNCSTTTTF